jgi:hypothetical protein
MVAAGTDNGCALGAGYADGRYRIAYGWGGRYLRDGGALWFWEV